MRALLKKQKPSYFRYIKHIKKPQKPRKPLKHKFYSPSKITQTILKYKIYLFKCSQMTKQYKTFHCRSIIPYKKKKRHYWWKQQRRWLLADNMKNLKFLLTLASLRKFEKKKK